MRQGTGSHALSREDAFVEALLFTFSGYLFRGWFPPQVAL